MKKRRLTEEYMLQYIDEHWRSVPEDDKLPLLAKNVNRRYKAVRRFVALERYRKEKGDDTYPVYALKKILRIHRCTEEDLEIMLKLIEDRLESVL